MRVRKDGFALDEAEVRLLLDHDYEVERRGKVVRVKPPASPAWLFSRSSVGAQVRFVRERSEEALAVAAMARIDHRLAFEVWCKTLVSLRGPPCAG